MENDDVNFAGHTIAFKRTDILIGDKYDGATAITFAGEAVFAFHGQAAEKLGDVRVHALRTLSAWTCKKHPLYTKDTTHPQKHTRDRSSPPAREKRKRQESLEQSLDVIQGDEEELMRVEDEGEDGQESLECYEKLRPSKERGPTKRPPKHSPSCYERLKLGRVSSTHSSQPPKRKGRVEGQASTKAVRQPVQARNTDHGRAAKWKDPSRLLVF